MYQPGDLRRKSRQRLLRQLIIVAVVIGVTLISYFLFFKTSSEVVPVITSVEPVKDSSSADTQVFSKSKSSRKKVSVQKDTPVFIQKISDKDEAVVKKAPTRKIQEPTTTENGPPDAAYKVISIAHFHNAPDEQTRRDAFINHWNNAILRPLDDKNGFIYIVYKNDEGQTSKGWLRKKDLRQINIK